MCRLCFRASDTPGSASCRGPPCAHYKRPEAVEGAPWTASLQCTWEQVPEIPEGDTVTVPKKPSRGQSCTAPRAPSRVPMRLRKACMGSVKVVGLRVPHELVRQSSRVRVSSHWWELLCPASGQSSHGASGCAEKLDEHKFGDHKALWLTLQLPPSNC